MWAGWSRAGSSALGRHACVKSATTARCTADAVPHTLYCGATRASAHAGQTLRARHPRARCKWPFVTCMLQVACKGHVHAHLEHAHVWTWTCIKWAWTCSRWAWTCSRWAWTCSKWLLGHGHGHGDARRSMYT
eukprot:364408-Chlamydomonas_euryale.AAC.2